MSSTTSEICVGACSLIGGLCWLVIEALPIMAGVSITCGAILGVHGVYRLMWPKKGN